MLPDRSERVEMRFSLEVFGVDCGGAQRRWVVFS